MKNIYLSLLVSLFLTVVNAQDKVTLSIKGTTREAALKMNLNGDRISWYRMATSARIANNVYVEISNVGDKKTDRASTSVEANPDANGLYNFETSVDVNIKKADKTKPLHLEIVVPTVLGNELFYMADISFDELTKPILLNGYMWRSSNEKIQPRRDLCLEFSSFVENADLRKQVSENENFYKFNRNDFSLQIKQDEQGEWKQFTDPFQGGFSNNNAVSLANPMPSWVDPSKRLFVRFVAKTPLSNYVWAEYSVEPHEYRREQRAQYYNSVAYEKAANPILKSAAAAEVPKNNQAEQETKKTEEVKEIESVPQVVQETREAEQPKERVQAEQPKERVQEEQAPKPVTNQIQLSKPKTVGMKKAVGYEQLIQRADSLFTSSQFQEAKNTYDDASRLRPSEEYPKKRADECALKLKAIQNKK